MHTFVIAFFGLIVLCSASDHDQPSIAQRSAPQASSAYSGSYPAPNNNAFWKVNPWTPNPGAPEPWRPYNNFRILRQYSNNYPNGYQFSYNTENQIQVAEEGEVPVHDPNNDIGTSSRGYYQYVGDDGLTRRVDWTANEDGYRPIITIIPNYVFRAEDIARSSGAEEFPIIGGAPLSSRSAQSTSGDLDESSQDVSLLQRGSFGQNKK